VPEGGSTRLSRFGCILRPMVSKRGQAALLHVDIDAFFVSVERLEGRAPEGVPVAVAGVGKRAVVASASYEARRFGVRSAQPVALARRLCPQCVFVPPRFEDYRRYSAKVMEVLSGYGPTEPASLDEAYVDVRPLLDRSSVSHRSTHGSDLRDNGNSVSKVRSGLQRCGPAPAAGSSTAAIEALAAEISSRLRETTGLSCSIGGGSTRLVAKVAAEKAKPGGRLVLEPERELDFLAELPLAEIPGVGPALRDAVSRLGVWKLGDLRRIPFDTLVGAVGRSRAAYLMETAWNRGPSKVTPVWEGIPKKSVGVETTFETDLQVGPELDARLLQIADRLAERLRASGLACRTAALKVRFSDMKTVTRSLRLPAPTDTAVDLYRAARAELSALAGRKKIRLVGVRAESLWKGHGQISLLDETAQKIVRAEAAVDAIRKKFGHHAVGFGLE
jgi:DNA polymerase-4